MQQVRDLAHWLGWSTYHTHRSERSEKGFPDLVLIKPSRGGQPARLIFSELKSIKGKLTPEQSRWLEVLGQVPNVETFCWRPHDWDGVCSEYV